MIDIDILNRSSETLKLAECRLIEYNKFIDIYNLDNRDYFFDKLVESGYCEKDALSILTNKDLLLSMFMNNFCVADLLVDTKNEEINVELEEVRKEYMDAVDCANQSIVAANEARTMMFSMRKLIEEQYGYDSNNWDAKSVSEMNEAIALYNKLVEKANEDTEFVAFTRQKLAQVRSKNNNDFSFNVDETENEYYNKNEDVRSIVIDTN